MQEYNVFVTNETSSINLINVSRQAYKYMCLFMYVKTDIRVKPFELVANPNYP